MQSEDCDISTASFPWQHHKSMRHFYLCLRDNRVKVHKNEDINKTLGIQQVETLMAV